MPKTAWAAGELRDLPAPVGPHRARRAPPGRWPSYWCRVWGRSRPAVRVAQRRLPAVVAGLTDGSWRVAEMWLKVSTLRGLGEAGPDAEALLHHELERVRAAAVRCLGAGGDTEHVDGVLELRFDADQTVRRVADRALDAMALRLDLDVDTLER